LEIRRKLVDSKKLEGIITLPASAFARSAEGYAIVIVDDNTRDFVHFVDGESLAFNASAGMLDYDKLLRAYFSQTDWSDVCNGIVQNEYVSRNCSAGVSGKAIEAYGFNFQPSLYTYVLPEPEGLQVQVKLSDIIEVAPSQLACVSQGLTISPRDISDDDFSIFTSPHFVKNAINANYREYVGPALIMVSERDNIKVCICDSDSQFFLTPSQIAFRLKDDATTSLQYVALMFMDDALRHRIASLLSGAYLRSSVAIDAILNTTVNLDNLAKQEEKITLLKAELDAFYESERQRLGVHTTSIDIAHMLKLPFSRIANAVAASIGDCDKESDMYHTLVSIRDNFDYIQRFINSYGADLSSKKVSLTEMEINSFLSRYLSSWDSFGTFKIELDSKVSDEASVVMNVDLMRVLMDTILDNAYRHGFNKIESPDNLGYITTSCVNMSDKEYICISIANNGKPFEKGFSLKDYVSRGKFSRSTGHTGIGGNHVYNIIKAHNGYLNITSNARWNVIVELLIPAEYYSEDDAKNFVMYGNSTNCI
jgi:signal transduction histidine kinase